MSGPVLLVHDDLAVIAAIKRLLARDGYEVVLATSAADAVIAYGHHLPFVVLLAPSVESGRGYVVLDELKGHPDGQLAKVILLGETIAGYGYPMAPMPPDQTLVEMVNELAATAGEGWQVVEQPKSRSEVATEPMGVAAEPVGDAAGPAPDAVPPAAEGEAWRAAPPPVSTQPYGVAAEMPEVAEQQWGVVSPAPTPPPQVASDLEGALFGDLPSLEDQLHREVEAQAMASVDDELQKLEDEVRAEAARRRHQRETQAPQAPPPADDAPDADGSLSSAEESFADLDAPAVAPAIAPAVAPVAAETAATEPEESFADLDATDTRSRHRLATEETVTSEVEVPAVPSVSAANLAAGSPRNLEADLFGDGSSDAPAEPSVPSALEQVEAVARAIAGEAFTSPGDEEQVSPSAATDVGERAHRAAQRAAQLAAQAPARVAAEKAAAQNAMAEAQAQAQAESELKAQAESAYAAVQAQMAEQRAVAEQQIAEAGEALRVAEAAHEETRSELALLSEDHQRAQAELAQLKANLLERSDQAAALEMRLSEQEQSLDHQAQTLSAERDALATQLEGEQATRALLEEHATKLQAQLDAIKASTDASAEQIAELEGSLAALRRELAQAQEIAAELRGRVDELTAERTKLLTQLEGAKQHEAELAAHAKELEDRATLPLAPEGKPPLQVPRHGSVSLGEQARLIAQLVIAQAEVKVELAVTGGTRSLWLKRGQLVAAESSLPYETLSDRARRDGLIDARQENELRSVRGASARELLEVMRQRGFIRDAESLPLVQRYTEQVALDAFTELQCTYRLTEEAPPAEVLAAASPRATLPIVAEALRRALPPESLLQMLGGSEGVPVALESDLDSRVLGFTERERRMLGYVDGEATVEMLVMAAGLKADAAYKALVVARLLGLIEVREPKNKGAAPSGDLDVQRLDAKYEQVQEADYFSILGLPRNAGADEVQRAYERLAAEFDPLRYSGHPDPSLQQRAQVVFNLLEEAARALQDDARRVEYARHLLD